MPTKEWRIGEDLTEDDNILDPISFNDVILAVHCNCKVITEEAIKKELEEILEIRMEDMKYLLEKNLDIIAEKAMEGRE